MRIRNKGGTHFHGKSIIGGKKFTIAPGETKDLQDHDALELLQKYPWHFEAVKEVVEKKKDGAAEGDRSAGPPAGGDSPSAASEPGAAPTHHRGRRGRE